MSGSENLLAFLKDLAVQIPSILTILVCMIFAGVRWTYHPRVSLVALIGLLVLLIHTFLFAAVYAWVPQAIIASMTPPVAADKAEVARYVYIVMAVIYNCLEAIPFVILLGAIFMKRHLPSRPDDPATAFVQNAT